MNELAAGKVEQAVGILDELGLDAWLVFVRETAESGDPALPLILGLPMTWQSAFIVTRGGDRIAIVGHYEDEAVRSTGAWSEVISYVQGIGEPLRAALRRLDPKSIALDWSEDDVMADGLGHGLWLVLRRHLEAVGMADRVVSAEALVRRLRGRKTEAEVQRIEAAIALTQHLLEKVAAVARPGTTERDVWRFLRAQVAGAGAAPAWDPAQCPIVSTGPDSMIGHGLPSDTLAITAGRIFHLDFGVRLDDYCADLQRAWWVPSESEPRPPAAVTRGFDAVRAAILAGAAALRPGAKGWEVDAAARTSLLDAGYPEYRHATGHHVGRAAHDGAGVLGPRWERYGRTVEFEAEPGHVYTLELGIENLDGRGYLGLEEMVLVTDDGVRWLSAPQEKLWVLGG